MDKEPITVKGLENLKSELENLKNVQRPKVVAAIAEARSHGDLKENAEYHAAKEQQGLIEGRVLAINDLIARANVIDVTTLTVTGTAGDTVGTINNTITTNNSSTGADVLSVESVTGLPATVGDTIEIRLRLSIPEQRNDRTITTTAKAITFFAFDQ